MTNFTIEGHDGVNYLTVDTDNMNVMDKIMNVLENDGNMAKLTDKRLGYNPRDDESGQKIDIKLPNGYHLVARQNESIEYKNEIYLYVEDKDGNFVQDLALVRNGLSYDKSGNLRWKDKEFEILVYGGPNNEDYTGRFPVGLYTTEGRLIYEETKTLYVPVLSQGCCVHRRS